MNENLSYIDHASGIRLPDGCTLVINRKKDNDVTNCCYDVFIFPSLVIGLSFMSISWLVLVLWQFSFIKDWPESGNQKNIWVLPNIWRLGRVGNTKLGTNTLIKCYWMLRNARVTTFTVSEPLDQGKTNKGEGKTNPLPLLSPTLWLK